MSGRDLADAGDDGLDYETPIPARWEVDEASDRAEAREARWQRRWDAFLDTERRSNA